MSRTQTMKENMKDRLQDRIEELRSLRDTIRVDLHLASMELRDEWKGLEGKLPDPASAAEQIREVTGEALDRLAAQLRGFRARLREGGKAEQVGQLMTKEVVTCAPSDSLARAVTLMFDRDIGWLPAVDAAGKVCGVITDRDAAIAAATRGQRMDEIRVDSVMTRELAACPPEAPPQEALALLRSRRLHRLAVVTADGALAGVVTINDLARARAARLDGATAAAGPAEIVLSLAAISAPSAPSADAN